MTCPITRSSSKFPTKWLSSFHVITILVGAIVWNHFVFVNSIFHNLSTSSWIDPQNQARIKQDSDNKLSTAVDGSNLSYAQNVHSKTTSTILTNDSMQNLNSTQISMITVSRGPLANIVLLGQFNYDTTFDVVEKWRNIWSKYFTTIIVAGPFSSKTEKRLKAAGIPYHIGRDDEGYVSPYENLVDIMRQLQTHGQNSSSALLLPSSNFDGVLYMHDDGLLNIKKLLRGRPALPTDSFVTADFTHGVGLKQNMGYAIHVEWEWRQWPNGTELSSIPPFFSFEHLPDDGILNRTMHQNITGLLNAMPHWPNLNMCLEQQVTMLSNYDQTWWDEFADYFNTSIARASASTTPSATPENVTASSEVQVLTRTSYRFTFPGYSQSDFLYAPLQYTDVMDRAIQPHIQGEVFLECAVPTILQWVIKSLARSNKARPSTESNSQFIQPPVPSIESLPLCTDFSPIRGTKAMIMNCLKVSSNWGFYHPFKLRQFGAREFETWLQMAQRGDRPNGTPISHMYK